MAETLFRACVGLLWILTLVECKAPDAHVSCEYSEDCVLPCSFKATGNDVIEWFKNDELVYSFTAESEGQSRDSDHRMAYFQGQVSRGNGSVLLRRCSVQDRGRYTCRANTSLNATQESLVVLKVEAPIRTVAMEMNTNGIQCISDGIFPPPRVQWATDPPSHLGNLVYDTRMTSAPNGLYSVSSRLDTAHSPPHLTYICIINSKYGSQSWRSSLQEREIFGEEGQALTIPCTAPPNLQNFTLTWTFSRTTDPTVILTYDSRTRRTSNLWEDKAQLEQDKVLNGIGSLRLKNLKGHKLSGTYTCTFVGFQMTHLVQTRVNISPTSQREARTGSRTSGMWVIAVVVAVVALLITAAVLYRRHKAKRERASHTPRMEKEMESFCETN